MNLVRATRQAIERRMSLSEFDSMLDLFNGGGVGPTYTGKLVSPQSAIGVSAYWACVNVLADDFATLPVIPYSWIEPGVSKEEARGHYLWPLLTEEANFKTSAHDFKQQMEVWRNIWGNCYAEIETNGRGQVIALWPWRPDRVKVWLTDPSDVRSQVNYTYVPIDRRQNPITLSQDHILHVRGTSLDGITGLSPLQIHRHTLALSMGMTEFAGRFYGNGTTVRGVLQHPGTLGDKAAKSLRESLAQYRGVENSHKLLILEEAMQYKETGMKLVDAQFIESMNFSAEEVARIMKVPQHRIGLLGKATFSNITQQSMEYVQYSLGPNASNWCGRMHCSLLSARERDNVFLEPDFNYLLTGDPQMRAALYTVLANTGAYGPDDIRHGEGKNPLPKGVGKLPRVPLNTAPIGSDQANSPKPKEPTPIKPEGKTVPAEGRGNYERRDGWVTINGTPVFIGTSEGNLSAKQKAAIASRKPCGKDKQDIAEKSEAKVSKALGLPRTKDNSAFDLRNDDVGVEIKTMVDGKSDKITMSKAALSRKLGEAQAEGLKTFTVVADARGGATKYYVSNKLGSIRLGSMVRATLPEIKEMVHQ
jgi:HK97 family phage portal protein